MKVDQADKILNKPFYAASELVEIGLFPNEYAVRKCMEEGKLKFMMYGKKSKWIPKDSVMEYLQLMEKVLAKKPNVTLTMSLSSEAHDFLNQMVEIGRKEVTMNFGVQDFVENVVVHLMGLGISFKGQPKLFKLTQE